MLTIRKEQMQVFEQAAMGRFKEEMVAHCKEFSPALCTVIGDGQIRLAVRGAIERSSGYGFTNRGPIRLFIELMLLLGSTFDTDPQYPWTSEILNAASDQMIRAERLYERVLDYQEKVPDSDPARMRKVLQGLPEWAGKHESSSITAFVSSMLQEMARLLPEKTAYVGDEGLTDLVLKGCTEAERCQVLTIHGQAVMGVLMFTFGHGCMDDPLYPWIAQILTDKQVMDPTGRAVLLEKEACVFLERMISIQQERKKI